MQSIDIKSWANQDVAGYVAAEVEQHGRQDYDPGVFINDTSTLKLCILY